jgi:putative tricarboxylic transport membrane protein
MTMKIGTLLSRKLLTALCAGAALLPGLAAAQEYPSEPIRLIVPFNAGGSNDRMARALAPHMSEALGTPVVVENKPGAGTLLGHSYFLQQPDDGYAFLVTAPHPYMSNNILTQNAPFTLNDFAWINLPWQDTSIMVTANDNPANSLSDLLTTIKANPGDVSIGVVANSSDHINAVMLLDAVGIDPASVKWVTYSGGGPLRTATAGAHVDVGSSTADGTRSVFDLVKPLVVFSDKPVDPWAAEPVTAALAGQGAKEREYLAGSIRGIAAHASFKENHPDRWEKVSQVIEEISSDPAVQKEFAEKGMRLEWLGPAQSNGLVRKNYELLEGSVELMSE